MAGRASPLIVWESETRGLLVPDFRAERSPSPDGQGVAKGAWARAWGAYVDVFRPVAKAMLPLVRPLAEARTFDLLGFWVVWHTCGGFEGLQTNVGMSRSGIYRRVSAFRTVFGEHPDTFRFPGVNIDVQEVVDAAAKAAGAEAQPSA